jgi:hypothetical protein
MSLSRLHAFVVIPLFASTLLAGPQIQFDTKAFQCGTVIEGKVEKLKAVFIVKNTGDSILKLQNVRPGCGCTVVKYDSVVSMGKSVKIEAEVNIKPYHSGKISKGITVSSNAVNEPTASLLIEATIESVIEVSTSYVDFDETKGNSSHEIALFSKKADLKVIDVSFVVENAGTTNWQSAIPLVLKYKWALTDSVRSDGNRIFKLGLVPPVVDKSISGELVIKTNHPEKPEIKLKATIRR